MHTVKTKPFHHQDMGFNNQRHIPCMRDPAQGVGNTGDAVFVVGGKRKADAGNICTIQNGSKAVRKHGKIKVRWCNQVDLGAVCVGHAGIL